MNELHLFAGSGGGILGGILLGHNPVCAVELDPYCRKVLLQRQRDGILPRFPIWDNIETFDGTPWRGRAKIVCGGFPCQDISGAGKGAGIDGAKSGLWRDMARIVGEVRPEFVFVENSQLLVSRGLARVLGDLAGLGYSAEWGIVSAADLGAPHLRKRIWILAHTSKHAGAMANANGQRFHQMEQPDGGRTQGQGAISALMQPDNLRDLSHAHSIRLEKRESQPGDNGKEFPPITGENWWVTEPELGRMADGVAARVDRLRAIGNGQVAIVAASAFRELHRRLMKGK